MSKYQSVTTAIQLVEACGHIMSGGLVLEGNAAEIAQDLRDIARDARYGGKWEGDFEKVATALSYCEQLDVNCSVCPYKNEVACRQALKRDAKNAIRTLMARLEKRGNGG